MSYFQKSSKGKSVCVGAKHFQENDKNLVDGILRQAGFS